MAEKVKEYIEQNNLDGVTLIGHSLGGKTVMAVASQIPNKIANMIVLDIAPKQYDGKDQAIIFSTLNSLDLTVIE